VTITNNTTSQQAFFFDARLNTTAIISLANINPPSTNAGYALPLTLATGGPQWLVPTQTSAVQAVANATLPVIFDYGANQGDPDLFGAPAGTNSAVGTYVPAGGKVQQGVWYSKPTEIGPYSGPATPGLVNMTLTAATKAFDTTVTAPGGDLWWAALDANVLNTFRAIIVNPGQTVSIPVTVTPYGPSGTVVSGTIYVDTLVAGLPPYGQVAGDEVAAFPYSYTIQ